METYLAIITTVLVLTQIVRLVQNAIQLKRQGNIIEKNNFILRVYGKLETVLDMYLEGDAAIDSEASTSPVDELQYDMGIRMGQRKTLP